jgi:hypothetical protein
MKPTIAIILGSAALVLAVPAHAQPDPLAPAAKGMAQCSKPDKARKTCSSLAYYKSAGGAHYDNRAIVMVSPQGPVLLETNTPVEVKNGAVCGAIRKEDVMAGKVRVGGNPLTGDQAAAVLGQLAQALAPVIGKEICTSYAADGDGFVGKSSIAGAYMPELDTPGIWVSESDGYTVAP